ncbi:putative tetratricopeptide-like helical domain, DYW domain-containing protein [Rosa chinensis]|uniref:Putative tetratricopeptide-like helical domain, DYW domain-containing protein n=2 Tax=Rosa chinensis TaxID=74649 RepID=A0A2P6R5R0_ROSCH|nr:putative tetratricopeptide-like helical domain, DYW domain-containing protein [Rosa chinensis]
MDQIMVTTRPHLLSSSLLPLTIQNLQQPFLPSKSKLNQTPNPNSDPSKHQPSITYSFTPSLEQTQQIHAHMIKTQFDHTLQIPLNSLQTHMSPSAQYNFLITSYIKNHHPKLALKLYTQMRRMGTQVDNFTIPSVLKACGQASMELLGRETHGFALKSGFDSDVFVCNALIQMYSECGSLVLARLVFDEMIERDVVSWSTMINCYVRNRVFGEALELIREMHCLQVKPSEVAMISMVSLFADIADVKMGKAMHAYVARNSSNERMVVHVTTALVDMYVKCGNLAYGRRLFDGLAQKSVVSWTAMIAGCIRCNEVEEGVKLFKRMLEERKFPNEITMLSLVIESGSVGALELGKWLHAYVLRNGFVMSLALATALVDMYGKCGEAEYARAVFDSMEKKDVMIWSAMISAYARSNCTNQASELFARMKDSGIRPNQVTMVSLISLCAEVGALDLGKWVHSYINQQRIEVDVILRTALVDMYAKCGEIDAALRLFSEARYRDSRMWNAMITGFSMHGCGKQALELFEEMQRAGVEPNDITFIGLLHACSHAGLVADGKKVFEKMVLDFGLAPKVEHYGCMVDLLGRAGKLDEAHELIKSMPVEPNPIVWGSLLAACKIHKSPNLAEVAARQLLELEPQNCGYNVLMSNIYAASNRWIDVAGVRKAMEDKGTKKEPGLSSIEVNGAVHDFMMGDKTHPQTRKIYEMLAEMIKKLKEAGYTPNTSVVLQNIDEEEKETAVNYHSEKLAMAFGLISTAAGTPIRIVKNLRVCDDCHTATKLLSKIYGRVMTVRDRNRFHHFIEGSCSCGDYW